MTVTTVDGHGSKNSTSRRTTVAAASSAARGECKNRSIIAAASVAKAAGSPSRESRRQNTRTVPAPLRPAKIDPLQHRVNQRAQLAPVNIARPFRRLKNSAHAPRSKSSSSGEKEATSSTANRPLSCENENRFRARPSTAIASHSRGNSPGDLRDQLARLRHQPIRDRPLAPRPPPRHRSAASPSVTRTCGAAYPARQRPAQRPVRQTHMPSTSCSQSRFGFVRIVDAARQNEVVRRPRAGDVQQPLPLLEVLAVLDVPVQIEPDAARPLLASTGTSGPKSSSSTGCDPPTFRCRSRSGSTTSGNSSPFA